MKKLIASVFLLAGICGGGGCESVPAQEVPSVQRNEIQAQPYVGFTPDEIDLGSQFWHDEVPFELIFVNDGPEPVTIGEITADCGCKIFNHSLEGSTLNPGERNIIYCTFSTGPYCGHKKRTIRIINENGSTYAAFVAADVVPSYKVRPRRIELVIDDENSPMGEFNFDSENARILSIKADTPWLLGIIEGDRVLVYADGDRLPHGRTRGTLILQIDDEYLPEYAVPVVVSKRVGIDFRPSHVFIPRERASEQKVIVCSDATIADVRSEKPELSFETVDKTITIHCDKNNVGLGTANVLVVLSDGTSDSFQVTIVE